MKKLTATLTAALCLAAALSMGLFTGQEQSLAAEDAAPIGDAAPAFSLPDVVTSSDVSLADQKDKVVVLLFHSTGCPYYAMNKDKGYDRVFVKMVEAYKDKGVVFLGVNSNKNESVEKIKKYVEKHDINYAVLKDEGNKIADAYGATVASHVMVIDQEGKLRYRGGVEKASHNPADCGNSDTQYLAPVIDALLDGKEPPYTETKPVGCAIQKV